MSALPSERYQQRDVAHDLFMEVHKSLRQLQESGILDEGDPLLTQSFIEGETFVPELIDAALVSIDNDQVLIDGLKVRIDDLSKRKSRIEKRVTVLRGLIEQILVQSETKWIETRLATVSVKAAAQQLGEIDESKLPSKYFVPQDPKLDRKALLKDLRDGVQVDGATLNNGGLSLAIRR